MKNYKAVSGRAEREMIVSRSRFIAQVSSIKDAADAVAFIAEVKKKYPDATHHCYAYIADELGNEQRFSDDGEPQGTAGLPMLEVLKKRALFKTAGIVTRYFGGVKLGANGLVSAYTQSLSDVLDSAKTVCFKYCAVLKVGCGYACYQTLENRVRERGWLVRGVEFGIKAVLEIAVPAENIDDALRLIADVTSGLSVGKTLNFQYIEF